MLSGAAGAAVAEAPSHGEGLDKKSINPELWQACAGPLVNLPVAGTHVVYFPQGHSDQIAASLKNDVEAQLPNYPKLPSKLLCILHNVALHADPESDDIYAQLTLQPVPSFDEEAFCRSDLTLRSNKPQIEFFCKTLTASDTSTHGGFSVPRRAAEKIFPPLDFSMQPPAQEISVRDLHDNIWIFRHIYRGQPKRHLLTTGWSLFVSGKKLSAGDSVLFIRDERQQLLLGIRRANRNPTNLSTSMLSSASMHIGILAAAAHAAANNSLFTVFYNPRASASEFVIPLAKYYKAVYNNQISLGMRFRMMFETEDSGTRRYMGTITGISDIDPLRWKNSPWRNLQVGWDESTIGEKCSRVSIWEIEPVTAPFFLCPQMFRPKRPRQLDMSDDSGDLEKIFKRSTPWPGDDIPMADSHSLPGFSLMQWMNLQQRFPSPTQTNYMTESLLQNPSRLDVSAQPNNLLLQSHVPSNALNSMIPLQTGTGSSTSQGTLQTMGTCNPTSNFSHAPGLSQNCNNLLQEKPLQGHMLHVSSHRIKDPDIQKTPNYSQFPFHQSQSQTLIQSKLPVEEPKEECLSAVQQLSQCLPYQDPQKQLLDSSLKGITANQMSDANQAKTFQPQLAKNINQSTFCNLSNINHHVILENNSQSTDQLSQLIQYQKIHEQQSCNLSGALGIFSNATVTDGTMLDHGSFRPVAASDDPIFRNNFHLNNYASVFHPMLTSEAKASPGIEDDIDNSSSTVINSTALEFSSNISLDKVQSSAGVPSNVSKNQDQAFSFPTSQEYQNHLPANMDNTCASSTSVGISQNGPQPQETVSYPPRSVLFGNINKDKFHSLPSHQFLCGINNGDQLMTPADTNLFSAMENAALRKDVMHSFSPPKFDKREISNDIQQELSSSVVSKSFGAPEVSFNSVDTTINDSSLFGSEGPWPPPPMKFQRMRTYTKVHKRGAVGRSIDIARYSGYDELKQDLARMFGIEGQLEDPQRIGWKLVYVDHENDVLLVGDDPWEEFVNCVRFIKILSPQEVQQMSLESDFGNAIFPNQACSSSANGNN